jgi:hypothetical protein
MSSLTLSIMEEFLRSGEVQSRKNALTALSVIETDESAELIAETAITDPDAGVRKAAERELTALGERLPQNAISVLTKAIVGSDLQQQQRAYGILGQLRSKGVELPSTLVPRGSRMRLATSMNSSHYPVRTWSLRLRSWKAGLLWTLLGSIFFIFYVLAVFNLTGWDWLNFAITFLVILFIGTFQAVIATQYTTPINLQLNRLSALLVEVLISSLCVLLGFLILLILAGFIVPNFVYERANSFLIFLPLFSLLAGAVRAGTILGFGRFKALKLFKAKTRNWLAEVTLGVIVGALMIIIIYIIFMATSSVDRTFTALCLGLLAGVIGLASAFAKIDNEVPPK